MTSSQTQGHTLIQLLLRHRPVRLLLRHSHRHNHRPQVALDSMFMPTLYYAHGALYAKGSGIICTVHVVLSW